MKLKKIASGILMLIAGILIPVACNSDNYDNIPGSGHEPSIEPDYSGVTIPRNIAPMNFSVLEKGEYFIVTASSANGSRISVESSDGSVCFPLKSWKNLAENSGGGRIQIEVIVRDKEKKLLKFDPFYIKVANEKVDPYLCYRLLYPGYSSWAEMKIVQRSTEDFKETSLFENQLLQDNCVNCHSFNKNNPDRFLLHVRGSLGGTYFVNDRKITRLALKTGDMAANAVYPSWHPSGRYVAFSSNKTVQSFHMRPEKNIEVYDQFSSLVVYDTEKNEMFACADEDTVKYMETFPCWSPDGNWLYYCRTPQVKKGYDFKEVKYDLLRRSFNNETGLFGRAEVVFDAHSINKSVSLPAISPDGNYLVFVLHDYGTFSIWHKEADLYLLNLQSGKSDKLDLNSEEAESWHCWSSNGKWLVFSSKRGDGLRARPYFAYFGSPDSVGKPFVLPQKDPTLYKRLEKTFNRPELITGKIKTGPRDFETASKMIPVKAKWVVKSK